MIKYKFPQFNVKIINPTITVRKVNDDIVHKNCTVDILLETSLANFGVTLYGFEYNDTWEDADITAWVDNKIKDFEV